MPKRKKRKKRSGERTFAPADIASRNNAEKAPRPSGQTSAWQLRPVDGQGVFTKYFKAYVPRKVEADFYEFLREAIPIIDAAIQRLTNLDGHIIATGDNDRLVDEIQEWVDNVPVNDIQKGLQAFHQNMTSETFEQGFSISEFVTDKKRTDIAGLRVADSKFIKFKRSAAGLDIFQKGNDDTDYRQLNPANLMYFSINNENQNPYGTALMRSCEFVSKALVTMQNSVMNGWERFGDPSYSLIYKTSKKDGTNHSTRRQQMEDDLKAANTAKRKGNSADFVYAIDKDSDIAIKVIGSDNQILELEVPSRHVLEQIVSKTGLPPWMLGLHWSTTERLSDAEAAMVSADVTTRQAAKMPLFTAMIANLLRLRGRTWKKGDWQLEWAQVNLRDIVKQAQARFLNAQADMYYLQNEDALSRFGIEVGPHNLAIGKGIRSNGLSRSTGGTDKLVCPCCTGKDKVADTKELSRPTPWPELDEVEANYEKELKYDWFMLAEQVFTIAVLPTDELITPPKPTPRENQLIDRSNSLNRSSRSSRQKQPLPEGIPPIEAFTFSAEQRAAVMKALEGFRGKYDWRAGDSAVAWYYGQSYSLGLIQAAKLIGRERPILDIIKNREIFENLTKEGFRLVKENATKGIVNEILPEMEAQVLAGTNPRHVAARLKKLFGDQNADWERLARTEMSMAAERAKLDEWKAWEIEKVIFVPAPDGCPLCMSLAGEYEIGKSPVPGADTHPRCRCSIVPA